MKYIKSSRTALLACLILGLVAVSAGQTRGTYYTLYGSNFLNGWQSLKLSFQNPRYSDSEIIPCIRVRTVLNFYDAAGDGSVRPLPIRTVTREFELDPGEAAAIDIPAALACDGSVCPAVRNGVYVAVSVFGTPIWEGEQAPPEPVRLKFTSVLVLREFGRTIFTLPAAEKGFDPQPDPPAVQ